MKRFKLDTMYIIMNIPIAPMAAELLQPLEVLVKLVFEMAPLSATICLLLLLAFVG